MANTTAVAVTFTLDSTVNPNTPPYEITGCSGEISYAGGGSAQFTGWQMGVGTPEANGADFAVVVKDNGYGPANQTSIGHWALTFIPRGTTTDQSPFGNHESTITGTGAANANGTFTLKFNNPQPKIKDKGSWDWALIVQINLPVGQVHCYASDPEMDVT